MPETLLALDPSSTRIGWAVFSGAAVLAAGFTRPARTRDGYVERVVAMVDDLVYIVDANLPRHVVIEVPSGRFGTGARNGASSVLALYGFAAGAVWMRMRCLSLLSRMNVHVVNESEWTRSKPKAQRARVAQLTYPHLDWSRDTGMDMADAVGIGLWWLDRQRIMAATQRQLERTA